MTVYIDGLMTFDEDYGPSCHIIADDIEELHRFARKIGLKRNWFQSNVYNYHAHYDIKGERKRKRAIEAGAIELNRADFVSKLREIDAKQIEFFTNKTKSE